MKNNQKYIFNYLTRIIVGKDGALVLKNPANKKIFAVEYGLTSLINLLQKFKQPLILKDAKITAYDKDVLYMLFEYGFIEIYSKNKYETYINLWEKNNWEDFLYFLKSIGNYEFVDTLDSFQAIVEAKESLFKKYINTEKEYNLESLKLLDTKPVVLSDKDIPEKKDFFKAIMERRTIRNFNYQNISFDEFSFILKKVFHEVKERKTISLEYIESSLANYTNSHSLWLNAIISVNRVEGLENGFYLYDYMNHSLRMIKKGSSYDELQQIIIGQKFMSGSAFSVFITVNFYNIFWRYRYPGTYKAVLLSAAELGHKFIISSNSLGMGSFTTPAIRDEDAEKIIGTIPLQHESLYYVAIGKYEETTNYSLFAYHYDKIMGDRTKEIEKLLDMIECNSSKIVRILDVACGSGIVTNILNKKYKTDGIDISGEMINVAKKNYPGIDFYQADMSKFSLINKYSVITCNFDSLNHLLTLTKWEKFISNSKKHLTPEGILVFDINTLIKLKRISKFKEMKNEIDGNNMSMKVEEVSHNLFNWNVQYFGPDNSVLFEENILETSFEVKEIKKIILKYFSKVKVIDLAEGTERKDERLYFICKN